MKWTVWIWLGFLAFGLGLIHSSQTAHAAYQWRTLNVGIEVESSGDLLITETQSYHITDKATRQLQRAIPLANVDRITDVEVLENQRVLEVDTDIKDEQFRIRWQVPDQPSEMRTFIVQYRVQGGVRVHPDGDQIVWTALFGERATRLPQGSVTLQVPSELAGEIQGSQSYGVAATIRNLDTRTLAFMPKAELQPDETLKVKGHFSLAILKTDRSLNSIGKTP